MATRIISGLLLGLLFLLLAMQGTPWVLLAFGIPHLVAQYELTSLARGLTPQVRIAWIAGSIVIWAGCTYLSQVAPAGGSLVALLAAVLIMQAVRRTAQYEKAQGQVAPLATTQFIWPSLLIALSFALMQQIALQSGDYPYLLMLIGASWVADTAGVFGGKFFGQLKMFPHLSPGKTLEGAVAGMLAGGMAWLAVPLLFGTTKSVAALEFLYPGSFAYLAFLGLTGIIIASIGIIGDLWFSLHKRLARVKDYGSIIPGHGGVLDRFDAMLFAAPFAYLALVAR